MTEKDGSTHGKLGRSRPSVGGSGPTDKRLSRRDPRLWLSLRRQGNRGRSLVRAVRSTPRRPTDKPLLARIAELEAERDAAKQWATELQGRQRHHIARIEHLEAALREAWETALNYIGGPCDDPEKNPHVEVWCITHQEKRCTGTADYERALAALDPTEAP